MNECRAIRLRRSMKWAVYGLLVFDLAVNITMLRLERSFVQSIAEGVASFEDDIEQIRAVTDRVHGISQSRIGKLPASSEFHFLRPHLTPALAMGLHGEGACGYISFLEIEALESKGYRARPVQILNEAGLNVHVIVQVFTDTDTIFLDPLYNWLYINQQGEPASEEDILLNWRQLIGDAPLSGIQQYPIRYGVRYTNWDAAGYLGRIIRGVLEYSMGNDYAKEFSLWEKVPNFYLTRIFSSILALVFYSSMLKRRNH